MDIDFRTWLLQRLDEKTMSRAALARRVKVDPSAVSNWATGKDRPRPATVRLVAEALDDDPMKVLRIAGYLPGTPDVGPPAGEPSLTDLAAQLLRRVREAEAAFEYEAIPITAAGSAGQERVVLAEDEVVLPARRLKKLPGRRMALDIVGDCLEPEIRNGGVAVIDPDVPWRPGQTIALRHEGGVQVKRLISMGDGRLVLGSRYGEMILPETDARIVGTVVAYQQYLEV